MQDLSEKGKYISINEAAAIWGCRRQNISYHIQAKTFKDVKRFGKTTFQQEYVGINKAEVLALKGTMKPRGHIRKGDRKDIAFATVRCKVCSIEISIPWREYQKGQSFCNAHKGFIKCACGEWFKPVNPAQKFHAPACRKRAYGKKRTEAARLARE